MTTQLTTPRFSTYSQYARQWLIDNEIKLKTVYVEDGNYNPHFIYLNRVSRYDKNKANFRILQRGKDKVKNCILITFNVERHDREYLCYYLKSFEKVIRMWCKGTCQTYIDQDIIAQVLSGAVNHNGQSNKNILL